jgi:hypothetical protein
MLKTTHSATYIWKNSPQIHTCDPSPCPPPRPVRRRLRLPTKIKEIHAVHALTAAAPRCSSMRAPPRQGRGGRPRAQLR